MESNVESIDEAHHSLRPDVTSIVLGQVDMLGAELSHILDDISVSRRAVTLAAANGQCEILRRLHCAGADIHAHGQEALRVAVEGGRLEVLRYLHCNGADLIHVQDVLVSVAASYGHLEVLTYLHRNGCDLAACQGLREQLVSLSRLSKTLGFLAANGLFPTGLRDAEVAQSIINGNSKEIKASLSWSDVPGLSGLFLSLAARRGYTEILEMLCEQGAAISHCSEPVLIAAAQAGHKDCVKWITEHAPLRLEGIQTALFVAAESGHLDVVAYLYNSFGQSLSGVSNQALQLSALDGHDAVFDFLTDAGMDGIELERPGIDAMAQEIMGSDPVFHPSKLWEFFNEVNLEQLRRFGVSRFKRSVNQNYFNYVPLGLGDEQLAGLRRHFFRHPTLAFLRTRMRNPDKYVGSAAEMTIDRRIFALWAKIRGRARAGRFVQRQAYRMMVGLLWRCAEYYDVLGLRRGLAEPTLGSPIETWFRDRLISQDLAHSLIECNSMLDGAEDPPDQRPLHVAEVGPGYGRVGDILLSSRRVKYVVFDIPPSLYLAQWYLSRRHLTRAVFEFRHFDRFEDIRDEFEAADIAFFSINQIEKIPDAYFDLVINISSLHEMRPEQLRRILGEMYRISSQRVYIKQYHTYRNPWDGLEVTESAYFVPEGWNTLSWLPDKIDRRFFEAVIQRTTTAMPPKPDDHKLSISPLKRPTIAILLANFNDAPFLRSSLDAILEQTDPADEIILVDDGSTDGSVEIMQSVACHPRIKILRHDPNRGQHTAIQRALLVSKADYIAWAASDDLLLPNFVERNRTVLAEHPGIGLSFSRLATFQDGGSSLLEFSESNHGVAFDLGCAPKKYSPEVLAAILRCHYLWISGNTVVARRSALIDMGGFSAGLQWHADWFGYYALALRHGAVSIPETLARMRVRPITYSRTGMQNPKTQQLVLRRVLEEIKKPCNLDLLAVFRSCPSLLSPFGSAMVKAGIAHPGHWDIVMPLLAWQIERKLPEWKQRLRSRWQ
jgi:putative sugar O-methyltransferase